MDNDLPVNLTPAVYARLAKMLRDYEAGNLTPPPPNGKSNAGASDDGATFKVSSHAAGGGKYILQLLQPITTDVTETGMLSLADIGVAYTPTATTTKYLGLNLPELGQDTHGLNIGAVVRGTIERRQANGLIIVHIGHLSFEEECS